MSKKDGAIFAKSLFGYKKRDVNDYIRLADESNSEKLKEYEARIKELEDTLSREKATFQSELKKLSDEKNSATENAEKIKLECDNKLADSEARCASYLKLADAASLRADAAENRVNELTAELKLKSIENSSLKAKADADEKQILQLNSTIVSLSNFQDKERAEKSKFFKLRRPAIFRIIKK